MQRQFLVPQFIDVEDKIIGPITTRQFVIILVATLLIFIEFKLAQTWLFIVQGLFTSMISGILAFLKINGMPFHYFLLNVAQTLRRTKLRIWDKTLSSRDLRLLVNLENIEKQVKETFTPKSLPQGRLSKLSLVVNTGGVYKGDSHDQKNTL